MLHQYIGIPSPAQIQHCAPPGAWLEAFHHGATSTKASAAALSLWYSKLQWEFLSWSSFFGSRREVGLESSPRALEHCSSL